MRYDRKREADEQLKVCLLVRWLRGVGGVQEAIMRDDVLHRRGQGGWPVRVVGVFVRVDVLAPSVQQEGAGQHRGSVHCREEERGNERLIRGGVSI